MANISQHVRLTVRLVNNIDPVNLNYMVVPILWRTSFNDTNYVIGVSVSGPITLTGGRNGSYPLAASSIANVRPTGFDLYFGFVDSTGGGYLGSPITIHAIASHA